jgi:hypothetical protein
MIGDVQTNRVNVHAVASKRRSAAGVVSCLLAVTLCVAIGHTARAEPIDLVGSWFVLIHYKDAATANPDAERWLDYVWTFEMKGTRLEWVQYPIVVFEDTAGRFAPIAGNPRSRVLAHWEPNRGQQQTIRDGPRVNQRGSKIKSLKGSPTRGWRSVSRRRSAAATTIGFEEIVSIEGLDGEPTFERRASMGNAMRNVGEGLTRYAVSEVKDGGNTLLGVYERDDYDRGRFRIWRTAPVRGLPKKEQPGDESED